MNFEKIVWVKIQTSSYYNFLIKLNDIGITIYDNKKYKDYILIKTNIEDYEKIKKYLISYKSSIYKIIGIDRVKEIVKKYIVFTVSILISIIILLWANNLILKVEIKTSNKDINKLLIKELKKYDLGVMRLKKSHKKIEIIVDSILENNKDTLEWLEIKYDGLIMIVNVTEKTKNDLNEEQKYCNIIANTDAKIISMNVYRGIALKEINDYVVKGDVILSGAITHNEEIKNLVCASGVVFGEVWYKVKVKVPFKEEKNNYTGKVRYNLKINTTNNEYVIFKSRVKNKKEEKINLYKLNNFEINLVKEKEYKKEVVKLSENKAYNKGISLALEKIKLKLDKNEEILLQKVLKKSVNNSTIELEIFIVTKESIGKSFVLEEDDVNDIKSNPKNIQ